MQQVSAYNMRVGSLIKNTTSNHLLIVYKITEEEMGNGLTYKSYKLRDLHRNHTVVLTFVNGNNEFGTYFVVSY